MRVGDRIVRISMGSKTVECTNKAQIEQVISKSPGTIQLTVLRKASKENRPGSENVADIFATNGAAQRKTSNASVTSSTSSTRRSPRDVSALPEVMQCL